MRFQTSQAMKHVAWELNITTDYIYIWGACNIDPDPNLENLKGPGQTLKVKIYQKVSFVF